MIREVEKEMNICIPIGLDTKGPELRILNIEKRIFRLEEKVDYLFLSFVSKPSDILEVKHFLEETNKHFPLLISKIESVEGMKNLDSLIELSDGIMVARGDLGVEIGMLESMTNSPVPTRAEVTDIGNAVLQGVDCVMLSGETAKGSFPEQAVDLMHQVCLKAEKMIKINNSYNDLKE
ncbi:hypothetical protein NQ315_014215 [Exocentrus adspersus]|uniref:pyruvate kinase n=1 Tax=Exocentrus adspersus TaxID=1586481 RepID=A0AAV8V5C9_9CUCU|nr:hypothetical protein NQ315_014215 [Exocentrus adspersus]